MTWLLTTLPTGVPGSFFPDPESARELLQEELARPEYQEPFLERVARWFNELVDAARDATATSGGLSQLAAWSCSPCWWSGSPWRSRGCAPTPRRPRPATAVFSDAPETAEEHRRRANAALRQRAVG